MYPIYITEGIVLRKLPVGEANVVVSILTRDLGLVRAAARSARVERSKLRYGLEVHTLARFSFVRGRHEWRLVGAEDARHMLRDVALSSRTASSRVTNLLLRLMPGQEPSRQLFDTVQRGITSLASVEGEEAASIECVLVLRILAHLGYLPETPELSTFIENNLFSQELVSSALSRRPLLIRTINDSLHASGL